MHVVFLGKSIYFALAAISRREAFAADTKNDF